MEFKGILLERIKRTSSVESFRFRAGEKIDFLPGQFVSVLFDEKNRANRDLNKYLSFSASPGCPYVEITKRLSTSEFSRRLECLKPGDEVLFNGPLGKCVFNEEYKKVIFLAGGIGITPVVSIIEYIAWRQIAADVFLLYSNRTYEEIAFKRELDACKEKVHGLNIVYTLTDCPAPVKDCRKGRIDRQLLEREVPDMAQRRVFIYGPPAMVEGMKLLCRDVGCKEDMVLAENFTGY